MLFKGQLNKNPNQLAITDLSQQKTWLELQSSILDLAGFLQNECGLQENDHIALHVGNRIEFIELMLAGIVSGLWVTPINTHLTKDEAAYILENCDAKVLFYDNDHTALADNKFAGKNINIQLLQIGSATSAETFNAESPAGGTMLYTSGTTGRPKGVKRNKPNSLGDAITKMQQAGGALGLQGLGPHLVTGPLYHAAPMLFAIYDLLNGAPMIIMPKWSTELFVQCVHKYKVTTSHLVPTMFVRLLKFRQQTAIASELSSLKLVLHGAAPIAESVKWKMLDWWGDILVEYWGGSEAGVTTLIDSNQWKQFPGSVGKPLPHFEVYVGDANGNPSNKSEGPLYCRHKLLPQVFEYYKDKEKTKAAHPQDHVFCIGDIGKVDNHGYVYLFDRESNMIISGGVNIYPAEIEQVLMSHNAVQDCAVFGVANAEWGEEVQAAVILTEGIAPTSELEAEVTRFLSEKMARYKLPRKIHWVSSLPRTPTGKLIKSKLVF